MHRKNISTTTKWCLTSIPLLFFIGSIFHFLFELSGDSPIVGAFSAVNESVWEHQKMLLLPVTGWWVIIYFFKRTRHQIDTRKWFAGLAASLIFSVLTIPLAHYFYTEAFGVGFLIVDILILLLAVAVGQCIGIHVYKHSKGIPLYASLIVVLLIFFIFILFTFYPPQLPWFRDSLTGQYGI
ncbi:DUF6512 family protein [Anaerobium acetethylicum]|uniref:Uncharacterized protein n=1 Tax=Anaerobium acetethylicum TaxID=1619234 RepID=A0A1D3TTJ0_9FIRM|nr:DUF6512 family protein [Anaerobium acetethylicum]SCP97317.1 hypothetical protein SAMN05421730_1009121 [Anaerobium acetethylicum]